MWYCPLGFLITFVLGLIVSTVCNLLAKDQSDDLDPDLFFPLLARRIRYRRRTNVAINDMANYVLRRKDSFNNGNCDGDNINQPEVKL